MKSLSIFELIFHLFFKPLGNKSVQYSKVLKIKQKGYLS